MGKSPRVTPVAKKGQLFFHVQEGKHFPPKADPYVKVLVDKDQKLRTQIVLKAAEPKWDEKALQVQMTESAPASELIIQCADHNDLWFNKPFGSVRFQLKDLHDGVPRFGFFPLMLKGGKLGKGEVYARVLFMEAGESMTPHYDEFHYPLQTLMRKNKVASFKAALEVEKLKSTIEDHDRDGNRALHVAALLGKPDLIKLLVENGADIKGTTKESKAWPLHMAAKGNAATVDAILAIEGSVVEARDITGKTALHYAAVENNVETIACLLEKGADINAADEDGNTPLHNALMEKAAHDAIKKLIDSGAAIFQENTDKVSAAHLSKNERKVTNSTKKAFMSALEVIDDREFEPLQKYGKENRQIVTGDEIPFGEWRKGDQWAVLPKGATNLSVLMSLHKGDVAAPMDTIGYVCTRSAEGIHKEAAYQQELVGFGDAKPLHIEVTEEFKDTNYVLIPYAKKQAQANFSFIVYADGPFEFTKLKEWKHKTVVSGEWVGDAAAGCKAEETWTANPSFVLTTPAGNTPVNILLEQEKLDIDLVPFQVLPYKFFIGFYICNEGARDLADILDDSDKWKNAREVYKRTTLDKEVYTIVPTTFKPAEEAKFDITVFSDEEITLVPK
eukprot:TRINITY_DN8749_c0_g1_i1.p1 TRINITY_DN8749_c0_g1~~TRINITY_DN8749_c0_g1_i1.p1  ORF type:complete len:641 (+),score=194.98 TRINITY_DN8749_c0_g1_i1:74-1924(+)